MYFGAEFVRTSGEEALRISAYDVLIDDSVFEKVK